MISFSYTLKNSKFEKYDPKEVYDCYFLDIVLCTYHGTNIQTL